MRRRGRKPVARSRVLCELGGGCWAKLELLGDFLNADRARLQEVLTMSDRLRELDAQAVPGGSTAEGQQQSNSSKRQPPG